MKADRDGPRGVLRGVCPTAVARRSVASLLALLVSMVFLGLWTGSAGAHTDLESTTPADGESVSEPVSAVTLNFTAAVTPQDRGFVALDPQGIERVPSVTSADGRSFLLTFDPSLAGGPAGIRWTVTAADGHVLDGSFSFTVNTPVTTTVITTAAPETPTSTTQLAPTASTSDQTGQSGDAAPANSTTTIAARIDSRTADNSAGELTDTVTNEQLNEFLQSDRPAAPLSRFLVNGGRLVATAGSVIAIGVAIYAATALRASANDVAAVLRLGRLSAAVAAAASVVRGVGQLGVIHASWSEAFDGVNHYVTSQPALAIGLRIIGCSLIAVPVGTVVSRELVADRLAPLERPPLMSGTLPEQRPNISAWRSGTGGWLSLLGIAVVLLSFDLEGHTLSKGNRIVISLTDAAHVLTASIWAGGLLGLLVLMQRIGREARHEGARVSAYEAMVRFSVLGSLGVVLAGVAGLALTFMIEPSPSELVSSDWGRVLMLKLLFVAVAAGIGAYNHIFLLPGMTADEVTEAHVQRFRKLLLVEGAAVLAVVAVTAWLVVSRT